MFAGFILTCFHVCVLISQANILVAGIFGSYFLLVLGNKKSWSRSFQVPFGNITNLFGAMQKQGSSGYDEDQ